MSHMETTNRDVFEVVSHQIQGHVSLEIECKKKTSVFDTSYNSNFEAYNTVARKSTIFCYFLAVP